MLRQVFAARGDEGGISQNDAEWKAVDGKAQWISWRVARSERDAATGCGHMSGGGSDPVERIRANPRRIRVHPFVRFSALISATRVLFGEEKRIGKGFSMRKSRWNSILIEQEGSRYPERENAKRCLEAYRAMRRTGKNIVMRSWLFVLLLRSVGVWAQNSNSRPQCGIIEFTF